MNGFLLDTNCLSELTRSAPSAQVVEWVSQADEDTLYLSVLTLGEIERGVELLAHGRRKASLSVWLNELKQRFSGRIVPIDDLVAEQWGVISASAKTNGTPISVTDGLIAATAIVHDFTVVTRNTGDFKNVPLLLLNPWA